MLCWVLIGTLCVSRVLTAYAFWVSLRALKTLHTQMLGNRAPLVTGRTAKDSVTTRAKNWLLWRTFFWMVKAHPDYDPSMKIDASKIKF
jgi:hypothetical protein